MIRKQQLTPKLDGRAQRILILNWRCIKNPLAGGAEKVTHEIARRWVAWGHHVTQFCASYPGGAAEESVDGVHIVRRGSQYTVYSEAFRHYRRYFRGRYDLIIDEVNAVPFFANLYAREPVIMFKHQLEREVWHYEASFPVSTAGYLLEPMLLQAYRRTPIITVSESTKNDLRRLGLRGPCEIIPEAVDIKAPECLPSVETKEPRLTLAFVGRIVPSKRVDHIVRALKMLHQSGATEAQLRILGRGSPEYQRKLTQLIDDLGLSEHVHFHGWVNEAEKAKLLAAVHVIVMTSVREGWGLVITEANKQGTPGVVYDIPGLRDSTQDGETGLVVKEHTPEALAKGVMSLYNNPSLYAQLRTRAWETARELNWDRTAHAAWDAVQGFLRQRADQRSSSITQSYLDVYRKAMNAIMFTRNDEAV